MLRRLILSTIAVLTFGLPALAQDPPEGAYADFVPNANGEPFSTWGETAPDPGLVTRIFALSYAEACSWALSNGDPEQRRPEIFDLSFRYSYDDAATPDHPLKLYRFFCNAGAYNEQHVYMLWDGDNGLRPLSFSQPTYTVELEDPSNPDSVITGMQLTGYESMPTLVNSTVDPATGEITTRSCFRGICDASSIGTWVLNEASYRLQRFLVDPSYDGEINLIEMVDFGVPPPVDMSAVVTDVESGTATEAAMPEKTVPADDVQVFLAPLDPARRADADALIELMARTTAEPASLSGSIVGFGRYHYRYASGREGESFLVGFSPRASEFVVYLSGSQFDDLADELEALLARLGKHRRGKGCVYIKRLSDIDAGVLSELVTLSVTRLKQEYGH